MILKRTANAIAILLLISCILGITMFPFYWMAISSLKTEADAFSLNPSVVPSNLTLVNFSRVSSDFLKYLRNSIVISSGTTVMVIVFAILSAYALARLQFKGKMVFMISLLLLQMFPGFLRIIPLFISMSRFGLINNYFGIILVYSSGSLPFITWLLFSYFLSIPKELEDAAMIDGCTRIGSILRIIIPLSKPGIVCGSIFAFMTSWNEFFYAFIFITEDKLRPLSTGLSAYIEEFAIDYTGLMAMSVLTSIPTIMLFFLAQRFFVSGLTAGAISAS